MPTSTESTSPATPPPSHSGDFTAAPLTAAGLKAEAQQEVPRWVLDLLLGIAVTLVVALVISADIGGRADPDALAYLFALAFGALMLVRRRFPVGVLVATMLLLFGYYTLGYPAIGLAVPVAAALYSAAELGHLTASVIISLLLIGVSTYFRILDGEALPYLLGYELVSTVTLMAAAIALGDSTRSRRTLAAEQAQTARLIEQAHARRAEQRIQAERMQIARELHDVLGHSLSVVSLHAAVAEEAIGHDDEQARQALGQIRATTSQTMRELRTTVKMLRNPGQSEATRSVLSLADLSGLTKNARASGLHVDLRVTGDLSTLPPTVESAAYRIIQESLTNVMRHSNATEVTIDLTVDEQELRLQVVDNGTRAQSAIIQGMSTQGRHIQGSGIAGMAERARLLGGTFSAQPLAGGGFAVNATLPRQGEL